MQSVKGRSKGEPIFHELVLSQILKDKGERKRGGEEQKSQARG